MPHDWIDLERRLVTATGSDHELDAAVAAAFEQPEAPYTASVAACRALIGAKMPDWRLHLGFGASGTFPYASMVRDGLVIISDAPTVPLAILRSAVAAEKAAAPSAPPAA